jgi:hypothetical protein
MPAVYSAVFDERLSPPDNAADDAQFSLLQAKCQMLAAARCAVPFERAQCGASTAVIRPASQHQVRQVRVSFASICNDFFTESGIACGTSADELGVTQGVESISL